MKTLIIKVQTKSSRRKLVRIKDNSYKAYLLAVPLDGKANEELIRLLARELKLKKYNIEIIKGLTSSNKVISIDQ